MTLQLSVLQVLPRLEIGGVERGVIDLVKGLTHAGINAFVASGGGQLVTEVAKAHGVHLELPLYTKNPLRILWNGYCLYRIIKRYSINIIHCRSRAPAWSCWIAARMANIPFVTTVHGAYKTKPSIKKWYNNSMMKADKVIAISGYIKSYIEQVSPKSISKVHLIQRGIDIDYFNPNGIDSDRLETLKTKWNVKENIPLILFPARITKLKNHSFLIEALKKIRLKSFQCIIIGEGSGSYIQYLKHLINSYGLEKKIHLAGGCTDMPAAYMLADIVVQVTHHPEAFGRVVAEAHAMGKPVIAPDQAGPQEIILPNETGWLYKVNDQQNFLEYLEKALTLSVLEKKNIAIRSRLRILKLFNKDNMIKSTIALYLKLFIKKNIDFK